MSIYGRGSELQVVIIEETVWGTTPGTPSGYLIPVTGLGGDWYKQNLIDNPELRSDRNPSAPVLGNVSVNGSLSVSLNLETIGWFLKHGVGAPLTTGTGPDYVHTSKVGFSGASAGDLPAGLTIDIGYTSLDKYFAYTGCKVSTLTFKAGGEGAATVDIGIIGKGAPAISGTALDAAPTEYTSTAVAQFDASIKEGGATLSDASEVTFNFDNAMDDTIRTIGSGGEIVDLPETLAVVNGTLVAFFKDETLLNKAINNTESSLELTWTQGADSLVLSIPELLFEPSSPAVSGPAGIKVSLAFKGYYANGADATAMKSVLTNTIVSY